MSTIFKKQVLIESFPAYDVFERQAHNVNGQMVVEVVAGEALGLKHPRGFYREYYTGSVVSYSLESNECPLKAVERAKWLGHDLYWINSAGAMLSSTPQAKKSLVNVTLGMLVNFEGHIFSIEAAPNDNLKLVCRD